MTPTEATLVVAWLALAYFTNGFIMWLVCRAGQRDERGLSNCLGFMVLWPVFVVAGLFNLIFDNWGNDA